MNSKELIKEIRAKHGLSQEDLARILKVSYTTVNAWESGRREPQEHMTAVLQEILSKETVSLSVEDMDANHGIVRSDAGFISSVLDYGTQKDPGLYTHPIGRWYGCLPSFLVKDLLRFAVTDLGNDGEAYVNFSGSGTVALEMALQGRKCTAGDVNPFALLLSKIKTTVPPEDFSLPDFAPSKAKKIPSGKYSEKNLILNESRWLSEEVRQIVLEYCSAIALVNDEYERMLRAVALGNIIINWCNIDKRCTNHYVFKENAANASTFREAFEKECESLLSITNRLKDANPFTSPMIRRIDAADTNLQDESFDLVFSHPPYGTTVNYFSVNRMQISILETISVFMGKPFDFEQCRRSDFSSGTLKKYNAFTSRWVSEAARVLRSGGHSITVVGDSRDLGKLSHPFTDIITEGEANGMFLKEILIWVTNQKSGMHVKRKGNHIDHNYVIIMEKH